MGETVLSSYKRMNNYKRHHMQAQIDILFRFVTRMQELYKVLKSKYLKTIPNGNRGPESTVGNVSVQEKLREV